MAKLGPLAQRDSCTDVRGVLERFITHFGLVSTALLAGTEVVMGADVFGVVETIGANVLDAEVLWVLLVWLFYYLYYQYCHWSHFGGLLSKGVCLPKVPMVLKLYKYPLLFLIRHLHLSICLVFILLCLCSLILLMKCIHLIMSSSKIRFLSWV